MAGLGWADEERREREREGDIEKRKAVDIHQQLRHYTSKTRGSGVIVVV